MHIYVKNIARLWLMGIQRVSLSIRVDTLKFHGIVEAQDFLESRSIVMYCDPGAPKACEILKEK